MISSNTLGVVTPIHPSEFRYKHRLSIKEMHKLSRIPHSTLQNYLANPDSTRYSRTPEPVQVLFGLLDERLSSGG